MYDGTVGPVSGDGAEGKTAKIGVFCAKRGKSLFNGKFRFLCDLAFFDDFIERSAKTYQATPSSSIARRKPAVSRSSFTARKAGMGVTAEVQTERKPNSWKCSTDLSVHASGISDECLFVRRANAAIVRCFRKDAA